MLDVAKTIDGNNVYWLAVATSLAQVVLAAFFLERFLALIVETRTYRKYLEKTDTAPVLAFIGALVIAFSFDVDIMAIVFETDNVTILGQIITGGIIAGGSKAAIKLFQDVMGFGRESREQYRKVREERRKAEIEMLKNQGTASANGGIQSQASKRSSVIADGFLN